MKCGDVTGNLICYGKGGLTYTYSLVYNKGGYPYVVATAQDKRGIRSEKSGLFPPDGGLARAFLHMVARCAVSPYTLIEVYDEFLTHHRL